MDIREKDSYAEIYGCSAPYSFWSADSVSYLTRADRSNPQRLQEQRWFGSTKDLSSSTSKCSLITWW